MNSELVLILKAASFAAEKHRGQLRKDAESTAYINHPLEVARIVVEEGRESDPEIIAAALLHDTIEDTETTESELAELFGTRVASLVAEVTDDKSLPKADRKWLQVVNAQKKAPGAALIKTADKIANVRDLIYRPPQAWSTAKKIEYLDWATSVVGGLEVKTSLIDVFKTAIIEARKIINETTDHDLSKFASAVETAPTGRDSRYPLLKLHMAFVFLIPTLWYLINFLVYPPSAPTAYGIALVLIQYYATALGMSLWSFMPAVLYRCYLYLSKKQYSKNIELWLLIAGGLVAILSLKGQGTI